VSVAFEGKSATWYYNNDAYSRSTRTRPWPHISHLTMDKNNLTEHLKNTRGKICISTFRLSASTGFLALNTLHKSTSDISFPTTRSTQLLNFPPSSWHGCGLNAYELVSDCRAAVHVARNNVFNVYPKYVTYNKRALNTFGNFYHYYTILRLRSPNDYIVYHVRPTSPTSPMFKVDRNELDGHGQLSALKIRSVRFSIVSGFL